MYEMLVASEDCIADYKITLGKNLRKHTALVTVVCVPGTDTILCGREPFSYC